MTPPGLEKNECWAHRFCGASRLSRRAEAGMLGGQSVTSLRRANLGRRYDLQGDTTNCQKGEPPGSPFWFSGLIRALRGKSWAVRRRRVF